MKEEVDTEHAAQIPDSAYISIMNSIVRIEVKNGKGTGFFIKCKIKNKLVFTLFTNYHVIPKYLVNSKETIKIIYGNKINETRKYMKLDENQRFIKCFPQPKDVTVIEILESDNIPEDKYLSPDMNYKNEGFNNYSNSQFYLAGYPHVDDTYIDYQGERHISSGRITKVFNNFEFEHTLDTRSGSSGSPICLINNRRVIGIHKAGNKTMHINIGTFLGIILDQLENAKETIEVYVKTWENWTIKFNVNLTDPIFILNDKIRNFLKNKNIEVDKNHIFKFLYDGRCFSCGLD
jgi:V8-like Glu-specific endopeptidase